jgi:hypothetical protein
MTAEVTNDAPQSPASAFLPPGKGDVAEPPSAEELAERARNRCQRGNIYWQRHQFAGLFAICSQCGQLRS